MNTTESAIVLGGTHDKSFAIGAFLASFFDVNPHIETDVVVFHDGMDSRVQAAISCLCKGLCRFIRYDSPFEVDVEWHANVDFFTTMVFSKYECLRLLDEYSTVIWFDYDMIVSDSLDSLFLPVSGGMRAILAPNIGYSIPDNPKHGDLNALRECSGIHSPCLAFYKTLDNTRALYEWCINATREYASDLVCPDQVVLSAMVNRFKIDVYPLVFELYSPHPKDRGSRLTDRYVKIWHSYRDVKYWDSDFYDEDWTRYYCAFLSKYLEQTHGIQITTFLDSGDKGEITAWGQASRNDDKAVLHGCCFPINHVPLTHQAIEHLLCVGATAEAEVLRRALDRRAPFGHANKGVRQ